MSPYPFRSEQAKAEYTALLEARAKAWPVPCETRVIDTPAAQTFVRISGRATNPPLVLLHGAQGHSLTWIPNIAALSEHYRTYALDTINDFGLSVNHQKSASRAHLMRWLDEVFDALVPDGTLNLVGLSLGGWIASQYALHNPRRIRKLVLLAPAATVLSVSSRMLVRAALTLLGADFRKRFYYWLLNDAVRSGEAGRSYVDQAVADWGTALRCFERMPLTPVSVIQDEAWRGFNVPTLFMVGEHEKMYPAEKAVARLNRIAPQIRTAVIAGAGHDLWVAQAETVTRQMIEFLGE